MIKLKTHSGFQDILITVIADSQVKINADIFIVAAYSADVQFKKARPPSDITLKCMSGKKMRNAVVSTTYAHLISKQP
jgi:hypothetical protein